MYYGMNLIYRKAIAAILANKQLDDGSSNDLIIGGDGIDHVDGGDGDNVVISGGVDNLDINQDGEANIQDIEELVGKRYLRR